MKLELMVRLDDPAPRVLVPRHIEFQTPTQLVQLRGLLAQRRCQPAISLVRRAGGDRAGQGQAGRPEPPGGVRGLGNEE